jgi:hypothetical protein
MNCSANRQLDTTIVIEMYNLQHRVSRDNFIFLAAQSFKVFQSKEKYPNKYV